jgi:hypothetical protein
MVFKLNIYSTKKYLIKDEIRKNFRKIQSNL